MGNPIDDMLNSRKKNYKFLKIEDGDTVHLKINDYVKSPGAGFKGADTITFEVDVYYPDGMKSKIFQCTNPSFLEGVVKMPKKGMFQEILVTRTGEHTDTVYSVKLFKEANAVGKEEPPDPPDPNDDL